MWGYSIINDTLLTGCMGEAVVVISQCLEVVKSLDGRDRLKLTPIGVAPSGLSVTARVAS